MSSDTFNLAVFISGGGTNLQALIDACETPDYPAKISVVISNEPDVKGLERADSASIPSIVVNHKDYKTREDFEDALQEALAQYDVDLICLAGFMRILTPKFFDKWSDKIINTHPSLLPKHGGKGMYGHHVHKAVLDNGDTQSGVSVHGVIPECDQGPIIVQRSVPVLSGDTPETLAARVLKQEHIAYPEAVALIARGEIKIINGQVEISKA